MAVEKHRLIFRLEKTAEGSAARAGELRIRRVAVPTPVFMPVGTRASVRGVLFDALKATGACMLLANTYHLLLQPGPAVFEAAGGIHTFMGWDGGVLTDSGGYQVFSLSDTTTVSDDGVVFQHPRSGETVRMTPAVSIETQLRIGADIMMAFDECVPATADFSTALSAVERTRVWAEESLMARGEAEAALFGIVQGACHLPLRRMSAEQICALPFDGFAIGGLAVGEEKAVREEVAAFTAALLPVDKPRYLMGVGTPIDLLEAVHRGVDMFDCIVPTERAQQGFAFTFEGKKRLTRRRYRFDGNPIETDCRCPACRHHTRQYIHHLFKAREPLGPILLSLHNLHFYQALMARMRAAILDNGFPAFYHTYRDRLDRSDATGPCPRSRRRVAAEPPATLGVFALHRSPEGRCSIAHIPSGEVMHSVNPPDEEANRLYIEQSGLRELLTIGDEPLVVWDVGLGAGHNAVAAIRCKERFDHAKRPLVVVSFENDLDAMRLALTHHRRFLHLRHPGPRAILKEGIWQSPDKRIVWILVCGDFESTMMSISSDHDPEVVFYDPFSSKTNRRFWTLAAFSALFERCRRKPCALYTYANATSIRATLLAAGFYVADGIGTGPKERTTVAMTPMRARTAALAETSWLGTRWLDRFKRSARPFPDGCTIEEQRQIESAVLTHPQFSFPDFGIPVVGR